MKLRSEAFSDGGMLPQRFSCEGADISPPLEWGSIPAATKTLALICDDPDAPMGTWVHWVYYNIPPITALPEGIPGVARPPTGGIQGINDFKKTGYGGPCPPAGVHRYYFKLYALDSQVQLPEGATKNQLIKAMEGHILAKALLMGRFSR